MEDNPAVKVFTVDPYSARALILKLEMEHQLSIQVYETAKYCRICIGKEDKKEDVSDTF